MPSLSNNLVENAVKNVVGNVPLSENVSLSDVEMYLNTMVSMCRNVCNQGLNNQLLCIFVFSHNNQQTKQKPIGRVMLNGLHPGANSII